jgi:hypothetical protein
MSRIVLFNSLSANLDSATFEITRQRTFMAVGMEPGDFITFEIVKVAPGARSFVCGCRVSEAGPGVIEGVQELQCPACEALTQRPVRLTPQNPVVVLDFPQGTVMRLVYHGTGLDLGLVTVWTDETHTQDLDDVLRGCPPIYYADDDQQWLPTGNIRCAADQTTLEIEEVNECGRTRWTSVPGGQVWTDTANLRCLPGGVATEVEQTNQCGERRWAPGPPQLWVDTPSVRCLEDGLTVEVEQTNQCGDRRWANAGYLQVWQDTGVRRCVNDLLQIQEVNNCGRLRWVPTAVFCENSQHSIVGLTVAPNPGPEGTLFCWTVQLDAPVVGQPLVIAGLLSGAEQDTKNYPHPIALIQPGQNSGQLCVLTEDDALVGGPRALCLKLLPNLRIINELPPVCATVIDNDVVGPQPSVHTIVSVVPTAASITEGEQACWTVTLDGPVAEGALTINFDLSGSEQVVNGYTPPVLVLADGATSGQVCVQTLDDAVVEPTLQLCLNALLSPRVTAAPAPVCINVLDNDVAPPVDSLHNVLSVVATPLAAAEGSQFCWTVTLDGPVVNSPLALVGVLSGQEQANENYPFPGVTIPVGASSGQMCVTTNPNAVIDPDRQLCLAVQPAPRIISAPAPVCVTVLNDDIPVGDSVHTVASVTVAPTSGPEGSTFCWTVTLDAPVTGTPVTVTGVLSGQEQVNEGYAAPTGVIVPGLSSVQLCVQTNDSSVINPDRDLCLAVQLTPRITAAPPPVCATVLNNDFPSTHNVVSVVVTPLAANEGSQFCWTVTLNTPVAGAPLNIIGVLSGAEQAANSYPAPGVTIPIGSSSGQLCVTTLDNNVVDGDRQLCLQVLPNVRLASIPAAVCATVIDDESIAGSATIQVNTPVTEGGTSVWSILLDAPVTGTPLTLTVVYSGSEQALHNFPNELVTFGIGENLVYWPVNHPDTPGADGDRELCGTIQPNPRVLSLSGPACVTVLDDEIALPSLPNSLGGDCIVDSPSTGQSSYQIAMLPSGQMQVTPGGLGSSNFTWMPAGEDPANYEVRFDGGGVGPVVSSGAARGVWLLASTTRIYRWEVNGPGPVAGNINGTLSVRRVGEPVADDTVTLDEIFISLGVECP